MQILKKLKKKKTKIKKKEPKAKDINYVGKLWQKEIIMKSWVQ